MESQSEFEGRASREVSSDRVFSRKVFVGGLPMDTTVDNILQSFEKYGQLDVCWPFKNESGATCPPKGFCFLHYKEEESVHHLLHDCRKDKENGYHSTISTRSKPKKPVQVRPWALADSETRNANYSIQQRNAVFVGGVPRTVTAKDLSEKLSGLFGNVAKVVILTDSELGYPMGSAQVHFAHFTSAVAAISCRFVQIFSNGRKSLRIEVKPFILVPHLCDGNGEIECDRPAEFFCTNVGCLHYLCEQCWTAVHSVPARRFHKPTVLKANVDVPTAPT